MYKWNKSYIKMLLNYINEIDSNHIEITYAKEILNNLFKPDHILSKDNYTIDEDKYEINNVRNLRNKINFILKNNITKQENYEKYNKIISSKKDILLYVNDFFKYINPNWYKEIKPVMEDNNIIKYKYNNENFVIFIEYLNKYFISLSKTNTIEDFSTPIHEFLHIYSIIKNPKFFYSIESEFLSILGEMINTYEMKRKFLFRKEAIKYDINNYKDILDTSRDIIIRERVVKEKIKDENKIAFLKDEYGINKTQTNSIYNYDLEYAYSKLISYYIALELFETYKTDKEKCFYLCDKLITDNKDIIQKLDNNNIHLIQSEKEYIKTLKKEYTIYNQ